MNGFPMTSPSPSLPSDTVAPKPSAHPLAALRRPGTVRLRCTALARAVEDNLSTHFRLDRSGLPALADRVAALIERRFPDGAVPLHSRWRHFGAGGVDRKAEVDAQLAGRSALDVARAQFDLAVISVLLDAGAGPQWRYVERQEIDRMALPLQQRGSDELLALLDRVNTGRPIPAAAAPAAAQAAEPAQASTVTPEAPPEPAPDAATATAPEADADTAPDTARHTAPEASADPAPDTAEPPAAAQATAAPAAAEPPAPPPPARDDGPAYTRSEGLAVASLRAFMAGAFSSTGGEPLRADASALKAVDVTALRAMFQSNPSNPLLGVEGRAGLLNRLGEAVAEEARVRGGPARPAVLFDRLALDARGALRPEVSAAEILGEVLRMLAPVWKSGSTVQGLPAGDVWPHRWAGAEADDGHGGHAADRTTAGWVPFHKLSQWLTCSLIEPLQWAGVRITGLQALTGLPEYRNGGLFIDGGVIVPRSSQALQRRYKPGDEFIVEWRALTVVLLDELAALVRQRLGRSADELPLLAILEGGTWLAGRELAAELRPGGAPPVQIDSDGTVF
jgi:hypothetical protein